MSLSKDAVLLEVLARELARLAGEGGATGGTLAMAAELIRTVDTGGAPARLAADRTLSPDALHAYLAPRGVVATDARLDLRRSALGYSKDTYLISVETPGRATETIVVRRDLPGGPSRTTVVDEFPLVKALWARGLPLAEPLLIEPDTAALGQPFLISRGAPGEPDLPTRETDPGARREAALALADFLGALHGLDVDDLPVRLSGEGKGAGEELAAYFREWRGWWEECGPPDLTAIPRALDVLEREAPRLDRLVLAHSDVGFHNILTEGGRIHAVLDWEFSHAGEPEEDLAYCRPAVETLMAWPEFLARYQAAGGPAPRADRLAAYQIWRGVRNATCCALGRQAFDAGLNTDLRLAYAGRVLIGAFAEDVARQLDAHAAAG